ncbi:MAG: septal ring lytic transglycosylase RlpA family protein, partial [Desulfobacterales bacterium]|nr:septal ring lytic transglycosylase RlpA family protein [Desulfobacterales bacterium]
LSSANTDLIRYRRMHQSDFTQRRTVNRLFGVGLCLVAIPFFFSSCTNVAPRPRAGTTAPQPKQSKPYQIDGVWYYPQADANGFRQSGLASWYGDPFHGRKTANGETYNMHGISAAHKTLPFNTVVNVRNLDNGRDIRVRINDRGPFVRNRVIDLSYGAARQIGLVGPGTARVELIALGAVTDANESVTANRTYAPVDYNSGKFTFQVGAFRDRGNAERLKLKLGSAYKNAHICTFDAGDGLYYRVRVGEFASLEEARKGEEILLRDGYPALVVAE